MKINSSMCGKWKVKDQKQIDIIHHNLQNNEVTFEIIGKSIILIFIYMYIQKYVKLHVSIFLRRYICYKYRKRALLYKI